jgi:hypothetical protein
VRSDDSIADRGDVCRSEGLLKGWRGTGPGAERGRRAAGDRAGECGRGEGILRGRARERVFRRRAGAGRGVGRPGPDGAVEGGAVDALCGNRQPGTGERRTARPKAVRRVGFDLSFHVPKSVSVLHGLTGDAAMLDAFQASVRETLAPLEAETRTRVRRGGRGQTWATGNLVSALFVRATARPAGCSPCRRRRAREPSAWRGLPRARVVLSGDDRQRRAVERGTPFTLVQRVGGLEPAVSGLHRVNRPARGRGPRPGHRDQQGRTRPVAYFPPSTTGGPGRRGGSGRSGTPSGRGSPGSVRCRSPGPSRA